MPINVVTRGPRSLWYWPPFLLGGLLTITYFLLEDDNRLAGFCLELGVGLATFSALLLYQNKLLDESADRFFKRLSKGEHQAQLSNQDQGDFHGDLGPLTAGKALFTCVSSADWEKAFLACDENLKKCLLQAWVWENRVSFEVADMEGASVKILEALRDFEEGPVDGGPWQDFTKWLKPILERVFNGIEDPCSWAGNRRVVGSRYEIVKATPTRGDAPDGYMVDRPTVIEGVELLIFYDQEEATEFRYRVAGWHQGRMPQQGFPPTFWLVDGIGAGDHPGMASSP